MRYFAFIAIISITFIVGVSSAHAVSAYNTGTRLVNPLGCVGDNATCFSSFLANVLDFVIKIGSVIVILMLVYVGFLFVTAQGNDSKITTARSALLWTVVGALILLGAKAIALGIEATVNALKV